MPLRAIIDECCGLLAAYQSCGTQTSIGTALEARTAVVRHVKFAIEFAGGGEGHFGIAAGPQLAHQAFNFNSRSTSDVTDVAGGGDGHSGNCL